MPSVQVTGLPAIEGGAPAFDRFLVFGEPVVGDAEVDAVAAVLRSGWLGTGKECASFEQEVACRVGAAHAVAVSSCTAALHAALVAAGIGPGDEVVTSTLTFVATVHAILHAGATPVLADVDPVTLDIDPASVRRRLGPATRALMPVHFGGYPCDMAELAALSAEHELFVLEDAAHALGAVRGGRPVGGAGTACFSFYPNKNITSGEGGMVTTDDAELAEHLRILRLHGLSLDAWERFRSKHAVLSDAVALGFKYNLTDLQAALGRVQLGRLDEFLAARRELASLYDSELEDVPGLRIVPRPWTSELRHAHHLYVVEVDAEDFGMHRDRLLEALRAENIGAGIHYRAVHLHPYYVELLAVPADELPVATALSGRLLSLPLSPAMTEDDVVRVAGAVHRLHRHFND
jgi:dTDP-4-amino-4,6-dideoxygalactose transaminase